MLSKAEFDDNTRPQHGQGDGPISYSALGVSAFFNDSEGEISDALAERLKGQ